MQQPAILALTLYIIIQLNIIYLIFTPATKELLNGLLTSFPICLFGTGPSLQYFFQVFFETEHCNLVIDSPSLFVCPVRVHP